jgi:hypothetical protein
MITNEDELEKMLECSDFFISNENDVIFLIRIFFSVSYFVYS